MSVRYFKSLLFRSAKIQGEIEKEQSRPRPNSIKLLKLKKIRLAIKDKMEQIAYKAASGKAKSGGLIYRRIGKNTPQGA